MVNEAKLLMQLKNRERGAIDKAIETYTPYLGTVLYRTAGNRLPREDIEEIVKVTEEMRRQVMEKISLL